MLSSASHKFADGAAEEAGHKFVDYEGDNGQQQLDDVKAQAQVCRIHRNRRHSRSVTDIHDTPGTLDKILWLFCVGLMRVCSAVPVPSGISSKVESSW